MWHIAGLRHFLELAHAIARAAECALVLHRRVVERDERLLQTVDVLADRPGRVRDLLVLTVDLGHHLADTQ